MSLAYRNTTITIRYVFGDDVVGTPTAQLYVNGVTAGSAVDASGSGTEWLFAVPIPSDATIGAAAQIEISASVGGDPVTRDVFTGTVAAEDGGDLTSNQLEQITAAVRAVGVTVPRMIAATANLGFPLGRRANSDNYGNLRFYRGTKWGISLEDVGEIPEADEVYFTIKSGDLSSTEDGDAVLQAKLVRSTGSSTLERLNGSAVDPGDVGNAIITYESYVEESITKYRVVIAINDDATVNIEPNTYKYDVKRVGDESEVLDAGQIESVAEVTRAH